MLILMITLPSLFHSVKSKYLSLHPITPLKFLTLKLVLELSHPSTKEREAWLIISYKHNNLNIYVYI